PAHHRLISSFPTRRSSDLPAIWLRCVVDRTLPEISIPADSVPILYLPGVSRQALRAGEECPRELQPLVELQYRGRVWHQRNGREDRKSTRLNSSHRTISYA